MVGAAMGQACGVRDQATIHQRALESAGFPVSRHWFEMEETWGFGTTITQNGKWFKDFNKAIRDVTPQWLIWHYSASNHGYRGLPILAPLWAWILASSKIPVVLFLHEFAYPFRRRGWRGAGQAIAQRAALIPMFFLSRGVIVTTEDRAGWVQSRRWLRQRPITVVPVCSNLPENHLAASQECQSSLKVGVFGFRQELCSPNMVVPTVAQLLNSGLDIQLIMAGAPGGDSPQADRWRQAAKDAGHPGALSFTGVLRQSQLVQELQTIDVFAFPETDGPNTGKSTLAALLALGKAVVAVDGSRRSDRMVNEGALELARNPDELASALEMLLRNEAARAEQGERAAKWYADNMSSDVVAKLTANFLRSLIGSTQAMPPIPDSTHKPS